MNIVKIVVPTTGRRQDAGNFFPVPGVHSAEEEMLFLVRFAGEPDIRWRALDAKTAEEAQIQALRFAHGDAVEYGAADPQTHEITIVGTVDGTQFSAGI